MNPGAVARNTLRRRLFRDADRRRLTRLCLYAVWRHLSAPVGTAPSPMLPGTARAAND